MIKINPSILSKTVKAITPKTEKVEEAQIRGTIVYRNQEHFVQLDGAPSNALTPIANFAEGASDAGFVHGDRVLVLIKNHQAIVTKNLTTGLQAQAAKKASTFTTAITDEGITAQRIIANDTFTNTLRANHITADEIIAGMATIDTLDANYAHITQGVIDNAKIGYADVNDLNANYAHITQGVIDNAKIGVADVNDLSANYAHITQGVIDNAKIGYADVDDLYAHYAAIDIANVNNAWIENGTIKKAEVFDENVFDLSGNRATLSRLDASKINVANLRADNLVVRRINGQPVVGGYTLIDSNSPGYSSKNPQALGWYEFVNADWVLSTDTTVDITKAYYQEGNEVSLYDQAYIDGLEDDLQQQIDGAVETYTGSVVPTLVNWPYTDWYDTSVTPIHDERAKHVGDIYYVVNSAADENGYCYRFAYDNTTHAYSWVLIKDSDVTKALSDISELQTFESETTSWIEETDEGLETIRTNHTSLVGVVNKTVKESVQLWFTKANTTAPSKPTAEVTSTSTAGNAWRKVVPAWNASYPNYYYCWQYKFVDGTFGWSDVVRDIAMGETQGTARDAKNTADAALPASTFTSFESTTFKNVKDTVDEQSTKFTNMTTRLGLNSDGTGANTDIVAKESALETTVNGISTRVGKTETKLAGMYATSSTAAGTAAKVATIVPTLSNYELANGAMATVKFTAANTTASPTLNLNGTGAKAIKTYSGGNLTEAEYKWKAGSTFTFTYNGTNWLMQDSTASVRITNAETNIAQNAQDITLRATKTETYQSAQPNLSPWFSYTPFEKNDYWSTAFNSLFTYTDMGDGWVHIQCTNTTSSVIRSDPRPIRSESIKPDSDYTFLYEIRNNHSTCSDAVSNIYVVQNNNSQFWGGDCKKNIEGARSDTYVIIRDLPQDSSESYIKRFVKTSEPVGSSHWTVDTPDAICAITQRCEAGDTIDYELRISIYEGEYTGPYKPYAGVQLFASQAELKITNDNVLIKATRDGATAADKTAGGTSAIGLINVSPDNVKIAAKNVDITGTTTFSDGTSIQSRIDSVEVGGRNILLNTGNASKHYGAVARASFSPTWTTEVSVSEWATSEGIRVVGSGATDNVPIVFGGDVSRLSTNSVKSINGQNYTVSVYIKNNHATNKVSVKFNVNGNYVVVEPGEAKRCITSGAGNGLSNVQLNIYTEHNGDAVDITIWHPQIEYGTKATEWSPAPEDVQAEINAVDSKADGANLQEQRIYYRSKVSGTVPKPTAWITNTANKYNDTVSVGNSGWSTKVTPIASGTGSSATKYLYLYTCIQRKTVGGTVTSTDVLLDDSTTVIDGGNIVTGTVTANKLDAVNINASKTLTIGAMTDATAETVLNNNIEVGGRNLLLGTSAAYTWTVSITGSSTFNTHDFYKTYAPINSLFKVNDLITISFDWSTNATSGNMHLECGSVSPWVWGTIVNAKGTRNAASNYVDISSSNKSGHVEITFKVTSSQTSAEDAFRWFRMRVDGADAWNGKTLTILNAKCEFGNKATAWSPALEDDASGKNLMRYTHKLSTGSASGPTATYSTGSDSRVPSGQFLRATFSSAASGGVHISTSALGWDYNAQMVNGTTYTFSAWVRSNKGFKFSSYGPERFTNKSTKVWSTLAGEWTHIWCTGVFDTSTQWQSCPFYTSDTWAVGDYLDISSMKLEIGTKPTPWTPAPGDMAISYMHADSNGLRIASANPATQNQRIQMSSSNIDMYDSGGTKRLALNSSTGVVAGRSDKGHTVVNDAGLYIYDTNNKKRSDVTASGLNIFDTDGSTSVALFGADSRIGNASGRRVQTYAGGIQVYNENNELRSQFGSNWIMLGKSDGTRITMGTATNPHVYMNANGVQCFKANETGVDVGNPSAGHSFVKSDGLHVYQGSASDANEVAFFGTSARVGKTSSNNIVIDSDSFEVNDADDFTQFSITPSSTATSHTSDRSLGVNIASGTTRKKTLPKNITSFRITVYPSSGSASTATISIPATTAGATQSKTVGVATVTLTRLTANGPVELSVKANSQIKTARFWYTSPRRVANITAGGYDLCYTAGDSIVGYGWWGAGFLTSSKTVADMVLPINKPILAESVTVSNVQMITRQASKYTHGSNSSDFADWTVNSAEIMEGGIRLSVTRSTTTDAVNNDAIGINLICDIKFS